MDALVSTEWLAAEMGAADLRVIDASWFLPDQKRDAAAEYEAAHIPGAVFLDIDVVAESDTSLPHMLPTGQAFAEAMGRMGIADTDRIVVYDASPLHSAARGWWMLHVMGARQVAILNGGFARWQAEGRPTESGAVRLPPARFRVLGDATRVVDLAELKRAVAHHDQIVDARSPARFAGEEPEPRPGVVPGHIPHSINLHYARLFDEDGRWKDRSALAQEFDAADVELDQPIVATCGSGVTAATVVFALHLLGHDATLYDGSWAEWGSDPTTPKATGRE